MRKNHMINHIKSQISMKILIKSLLLNKKGRRTKTTRTNLIIKEEDKEEAKAEVEDNIAEETKKLKQNPIMIMIHTVKVR